MVQFSFFSDRVKHSFPNAVAEVISATKSKNMMPSPSGSPLAEGEVSLFATFSVYASATAKADGGQAVDSISKNYVCLESDESFAKAEELFAAEVDGTII